MSTAALIDSHCHLDFDIFDKDREQVMQRAQDKHISDIVIPGTEKKYWHRINKLCAKHKQLHPCYGLHPYWVGHHKKQDIKKLNEYIEANTPVAVGECGLDFRAQQVNKKTQLFFFEAQLDVASNQQLPVVIHSVNATETVIASIKKFKNIRGMIHSYSGSLEQAKQLIDLGFYISVGGSITYENAKKIKSVTTNIPLTSLIIETDSPDQADVFNKGNRNEPAYIINTLAALSSLRNTEQTVIAKQTTTNAKKIFNI